MQCDGETKVNGSLLSDEKSPENGINKTRERRDFEISSQKQQTTETKHYQINCYFNQYTTETKLN